MSILNNSKELINKYFNTIFITEFPEIIREQIIYLWNDGKRLRPILFMAFVNIINASEPDEKNNVNKVNNVNDKDIKLLYNYAVNIELLHCLSLIIDDLPSMDNEMERRNNLCFHIKYGIEKTNFFIYYLLTKITNNIYHILETNYIEDNLNSTNSSNKIKLIKDVNYITKYLLSNLIDGQYFDMEFTKFTNNDKIDTLLDTNINAITEFIILITKEIFIKLEDTLEDEIKKYIVLNIKKTGSLFTIPIINGILTQIFIKQYNYTGYEIIDLNNTDNTNNNSDEFANIIETFFNADSNMFNVIIKWGYLVGFLFQISDDYLDCETDKNNNKPNICNLLSKNNTISLITNGIKISSIIIDIIIYNCKTIWPNININSQCIQEILNIINSRIK